MWVGGWGAGWGRGKGRAPVRGIIGLIRCLGAQQGFAMSH